MPISYYIDQPRGTIFETWIGDITATDLGSYWRAYLADPAVLSVRRTLVDLRKSTIHFSTDDLVRLIAQVVKPALGDLNWVTAILVEQPVQFGVSRQYQVFAENYSTDAIFFEYDAALKWLAEQP